MRSSEGFLFMGETIVIPPVSELVRRLEHCSAERKALQRMIRLARHHEKATKARQERPERPEYSEADDGNRN